MHSEPRPATGGMTATGAINILGRPDMESWALYVREAVQNSWDARLPGEALQVCIETRELDEAQARILREQVFAMLPTGGSPDGWERLHDIGRVVTVTDRGTAGMGGPVRADTSAEVQDFADFVWNIGQPPDKALGGGTYGYGKSVHYRASGPHTIIVHTRCRTDEGVETRLIACAWGADYDHIVEGRRVPFTGRHWWGAESDDPGMPLAPLAGPDADALASALGLPDLGPGTGTSVTALAVEMDDPRAWGRLVAGSALWHCWPRLVGLPDSETVDIRVTVDGEDVRLPDPREHPELRVLVACLEEAVSDAATVPTAASLVRSVKHGQRRRETGRVSLRMHTADPDPVPDGRPFDGPLRHVALMRHPRLVVRYLEGPAPPPPWVGWGGVFVAADECDGAFAASEPPAHDDWVFRSVESVRERSIVKVTLERLRESMREFTTPAVSSPAAAASGGIAALSDGLGDLLASGGAGPVPPVRPPGPPGGPPGRRSTARVTGHSLEPGEDGLVLTASVDVTIRGGADMARLSMSVGVATADGGGVEHEAPAGAAVPRLLGWDHGGRRHDAPVVTVVRGEEAGWSVRVWVPRDTAVVLTPRCAEAADG